MRFSLSSNWSAKRHETGEALVDEALELGFEALELGYNTTEELAVGIRRRVASGAIAADSVHAFCPVPVGAPHGYPELYLLASLDEDERAMAAVLLRQTLECAESVGARAVVLHAGRIFLKSFLSHYTTGTLVEAVEEEDGNLEAPRVKRVLARGLRRRTARAGKIFDGFCLSLDKLLPAFAKAGIALCLENLPSIEAFPDEREMLLLKQRFAGAELAYWHDLGHGQLRENIGLCRHLESARTLLPFTRGIHIHDASPLMHDHLPPGQGSIDFPALSFYGTGDIIRVFEPSPQVEFADLRVALQYVRQAWDG